MDVLDPLGITITSLGVNTIDDPGLLTVNIYTRSGTAFGNETSPAGWTLVSTGTGVPAGGDSPSFVDVADFFLGPGLTGFAIENVNYSSFYTNGTGSNQFYNDANLSLTMGSANLDSFFGQVFSPRVWNGQITYDEGSSETPIPEPASLTLLGLGLAGMGARRWRQRKPTLFRPNAGPGSHPTATARREASAMLARVRTLIVSAVALCVCASTADAATITFSNATAITIPAGAPGTTSGPASPYPSEIVVSGFTGDLTDLTLTVSGLTHTFPDDLDLLLVGPNGAALVFMSDAGGTGNLADLTLTFSDAAAALLPDGTQIAGGTYRPTNYGSAVDTFPAPAPAGFTLAAPTGTGTFTSTFLGLDPNGVWSLYVFDDLFGDPGSLAGWSLTITAPTDGAAPVPEPTTLVLLGTGLIGAGVRRFRQRRRPDAGAVATC